MKTAEEWIAENSDGEQWLYSEFTVTGLRAIQLDAYRAGLQKAVENVPLTDGVGLGNNCAIDYISKDILAHAETLKEVPKK